MINSVAECAEADENYNTTAASNASRAPRQWSISKTAHDLSRNTTRDFSPIASFDSMEALIVDDDDDEVDDSVTSQERPGVTFGWLLLKSGFFGFIVAVMHAIMQLPQFDTWPPQKYIVMLVLAILAGITILTAVGGFPNWSHSKRLKSD